MARLSLVPDVSPRPAWDVEVSLGVAHVAVAQAVATALAIDLDFDLDSVDEVRIATNEVCTELADHAAPQAVLHLVFDAHDDVLEMVARLESDDSGWPGRIEPDLVRALTDTVTRTAEDSTVKGMHVLSTWFRKVRHHRRGPASRV